MPRKRRKGDFVANTHTKCPGFYLRIVSVMSKSTDTHLPIGAANNLFLAPIGSADTKIHQTFATVCQVVLFFYICHRPESLPSGPLCFAALVVRMPLLPLCYGTICRHRSGCHHTTSAAITAIAVELPPPPSLSSATFHHRLPHPTAFANAADRRACC